MVLAAVMRAGGTYVPVDPDYPADRVEFIVSDKHPDLILTDQATLSVHGWTCSPLPGTGGHRQRPQCCQGHPGTGHKR